MERYKTVAFMVHTTIRNKKYLVGDVKLTTQLTTQSTMQSTTQLGYIDEKTIVAIKGNPGISQRKIAELIGETYNTVRYHMDAMQKKGITQKKGTNKLSRWIVKK